MFSNCKLIIYIFILIFILLILFCPIPWSGDLSFCLKDSLKSVYVKSKHKYLNKPLNKKICKENLETISQILNNLNLTFWLSEGTALGARRDKDFISHDDDVDLGMWYKDMSKFKKYAIPLIKKNGFKIDLEAHKNTFIRLSRNMETIDIDFTGKDIECVACQTKRANCKLCNTMLPYLKNMSYITFLGNKYLCPDVDYLEYLYGKEWNIPKKEKFENL